VYKKDLDSFNHKLTFIFLKLYNNKKIERTKLKRISILVPKKKEDFNSFTQLN
jgi:hypothetical protein